MATPRMPGLGKEAGVDEEHRKAGGRAGANVPALAPPPGREIVVPGRSALGYRLARPRIIGHSEEASHTAHYAANSARKRRMAEPPASGAERAPRRG